jgi:glycosyltransferase involved in cell wall biosynthesis
MNISVIIPSLNPDERLLQVVDGMISAGFHDIILVDDGSDEAHQHYFEEAAAHKECVVLHHEVNKGKGRALKTAFTYFLENRMGYAGVVTVDGDNQHQPQDVYACVGAMEKNPHSLILGVRNFDEKNVPFKSRYGNKITSFVFKFVCGLSISDTQTGLRAIPAEYLEKMLEVEGERFEYETNMLLELKKSSIPFLEVPIQTVYINENDSTHFHPIRDSIKIYGIILKYTFGSLASSLIDLAAFTVFTLLLAPFGRRKQVFFATVFARILSSLFNYTYNRKAVFNSSDRIGKTMLRYYILCAVQMLVSYALVYSLTWLLAAGNFLTVVVKILVDTVLFLVSFQIQGRWVFRK